MNPKILASSLLLFAAIVGCDADGPGGGRGAAARAEGGSPPAVGRAALGINLSAAVYWSGERDFMNLAMGDNWRLAVDGRWIGTMDEARIDPATGVVRSLGPGESAMLMLTPPFPHLGSTAIRCVFAGKGSLSAGGNVADLRKIAAGISFQTNVDPSRPHNYWITLERTDPADPVRAIDCREVNAPKDTLFSPEFLQALKPFGVIRFLDWQKINQNKGGQWAGRTLPTAMTHGRREGVAIEHMVALANAVGSDPWFHIPYNADADYITRFARYVHDHLDPDRKVYVELGNEVWNYIFPVASQAEKEGLALKLSEAPFRALLYRYAQKATAAYDIWATVYADRPGKLVRVIGAQSANPWTVEQLLDFADTARRVDAVATAPYFGFNPSTRTEDRTPAITVDGVMGILAERAVSTLRRDAESGTIAARYGKRHLAYEAGQHVVIADNVSLLRAIQQDTRIYGLYRQYLSDWKRSEGDLMVLFNATSPIDRHGAWGLREYSGQPLDETPKRRAVLDAASEWTERTR